MSSRDYLSRIKRPSPLGSTVFVGLRLAEPLVQHAILSQNLGLSLINRLGGSVLPLGTPIDCIGLSLSPYRLILFLMSAGSSLKQIFWLTTVAEYEMPLKSALPIGAFNFLFNTLNSLLFINKYTSAALDGAQDIDDPQFPSVPLVVGTVAYAVGLTLELVSELQRKRFKRDVRNKEQTYTAGLFSLARHINYTGHILMRGGYALAAGGWIWSAVTTAFFVRDFVKRAIPCLDEYCQERYDEAWNEYKRAVPYKLIPDLPQTDVSRPSALPTAKLTRANSQASIDQSSAEYLDSIEEEWNKRVDMDVETLVDGMVDLVSLASIGEKDKFRIAQESFQAQSRAESMVRPTPSCLPLTRILIIPQVRAANSLLSITHSMKLLLLLSDEAQLAHRRDAELRVVQGEKDEARDKVAELLDELLHPKSRSPAE
ncbi:hypothetical protein C0992_008072 [Termitomyces sp. T32_za158]|nr:hypothetical protein C0992_008072 [Termitomyces sp. T32_za158]